jgi:hypothetical protein
MAFSIELWKHPIQQDGYGLSNWLLAEKRQVWLIPGSPLSSKLYT